MYWLYNLGLLLILLGGLPIWIVIALLPRHRRNLWRKLGFYRTSDPTRAGWILVHGVSVGEINAALPFVNALKNRFADHPILVTCTTDTGMEYARKQLSGVTLEFYPLDFPWVVGRFLATYRLRRAFILETELWPNFAAQANHMGIPVHVVNGRLSDRAFPRYRSLPRLSRWCLSQYRNIFCQSALDRERFLELGASPERVLVTGSMKFDAALEAFVREKSRPMHPLTRALAPYPVLLAASTQERENLKLLELFPALREGQRDLHLLLVPRKPDTLPAVQKWLETRNLPYTLRSTFHEGDAAHPVILMDTIGELFALYGAATVVFVGKTLVTPGGGQNPIEPAVFSKPVVMGPAYANFRATVDGMREVGAVSVVRNTAELQEEVLRLFRDPHAREIMGNTAREFVMGQAGAARRILESLAS